MERETDSPAPQVSGVDYEALRERLGVHLFRQRMNVQTGHAAQKMGQGRTLFHPENIPLFRLVIKLIIKCSLLWPLGHRNACKIYLRENPMVLKRLPDAFRGFRILQLSDLHLDLDPQITQAIHERIKGLEYDLCVITGDYRAETHGDRGPAEREIARLIPLLNPRLGKDAIYAILGNHDDLEFADVLERAGVRMLLNESVPVRHNGAEIYLAGIDDPHFYETDNLERALEGIPPEATTILLSHSAETYRRALASGVDYMLCGHTHGGQVCLPGGIAIMRNAQQPSRMSKGAWSYQELHGYTSAGTGCSMLPVRFYCPAEVTIHVLDRGAPGTG